MTHHWTSAEEIEVWRAKAVKKKIADWIPSYFSERLPKGIGSMTVTLGEIEVLENPEIL